MPNVPRIIAAACGLSLIMPVAFAADASSEVRTHHVLLMSVDGMHALDLHNCTLAATCPNLAAMTKMGRTTSAPRPRSPPTRFRA